MLPVSQDCLRPGSCLSNVTSVSGLSSSWVLLTLDKQETGRGQSRDTGNIGQTRNRTKTIQRHWYHWTNKKQDEGNPGTSVSGLSSSWVLFFQCYQCLWIVFVLGLVCPMLPVSQDCLRPGSCLSNVTSFSGQSRDTGNIGQTRPRTKTIQRNW
jgi:hypothetical protein